jgi:hypothetical protein
MKNVIRLRSMRLFYCLARFVDSMQRLRWVRPVAGTWRFAVRVAIYDAEPKGQHVNPDKTPLSAGTVAVETMK